MILHGSAISNRISDPTRVTCVDIGSELIICGTARGDIKLYSHALCVGSSRFSLQQELHLAPPQNDVSLQVPVTCLKLSPKSHYLAAGTAKGTVLMFDMNVTDRNGQIKKNAEMKIVYCHEEHAGRAVTSLCWSLSWGKLFSGCNRGLVIELDCSSILKDYSPSISSPSSSSSSSPSSSSSSSSSSLSFPTSSTASLLLSSSSLLFAKSLVGVKPTIQVCQCSYSVHQIDCSIVEANVINGNTIHVDLVLVSAGHQTLLFQIPHSSSITPRSRDIAPVATLLKSHSLQESFSSSCCFINSSDEALTVSPATSSSYTSVQTTRALGVYVIKDKEDVIIASETNATTFSGRRRHVSRFSPTLIFCDVNGDIQQDFPLQWTESAARSHAVIALTSKPLSVRSLQTLYKHILLAVTDSNMIIIINLQNMTMEPLDLHAFHTDNIGAFPPSVHFHDSTLIVLREVANGEITSVDILSSCGPTMICRSPSPLYGCWLQHAMHTLQKQWKHWQISAYIDHEEDHHQLSSPSNSMILQHSSSIAAPLKASSSSSPSNISQLPDDISSTSRHRPHDPRSRRESRSKSKNRNIPYRTIDANALPPGASLRNALDVSLLQQTSLRFLDIDEILNKALYEVDAELEALTWDKEPSVSDFLNLQQDPSKSVDELAECGAILSSDFTGPHARGRAASLSEETVQQLERLHACIDVGRSKEAEKRRRSLEAIAFSREDDDDIMLGAKSYNVLAEGFEDKESSRQGREGYGNRNGDVYVNEGNIGSSNSNRHLSENLNPLVAVRNAERERRQSLLNVDDDHHTDEAVKALLQLTDDALLASNVLFSVSNTDHATMLNSLSSTTALPLQSTHYDSSSLIATTDSSSQVHTQGLQGINTIEDLLDVSDAMIATSKDILERPAWDGSEDILCITPTRHQISQHPPHSSRHHTPPPPHPHPPSPLHLPSFASPLPSNKHIRDNVHSPPSPSISDTHGGGYSDVDSPAESDLSWLNDSASSWIDTWLDGGSATALYHLKSRLKARRKERQNMTHIEAAAVGGESEGNMTALTVTVTQEQDNHSRNTKQSTSNPQQTQSQPSSLSIVLNEDMLRDYRKCPPSKNIKAIEANWIVIPPSLLRDTCLPQSPLPPPPPPPRVADVGDVASLHDVWLEAPLRQAYEGNLILCLFSFEFM